MVSKAREDAAEDITVKAQWSIIKPTEYVEIVLTEKVLNDEELVKIVGEGTEFEVVRVDNGSTEGTKVVVKFVSKDRAAKFVESVYASNGAEKSSIEAVNFSFDYVNSFSASLGLNALLCFLACFIFF